MIQLEYALGGYNFLFEKADAAWLLQHIKADNAEVQIQLQSGKEKNITLQYCQTPDDNDYLFANKSIIKLWLSKDTCEYIIHKLEYFLEEGDFFPAEVGSFIPVDKEKTRIDKKISSVYLCFIKK